MTTSVSLPSLAFTTSGCEGFQSFCLANVMSMDAADTLATGSALSAPTEVQAASPRHATSAAATGRQRRFHPEGGGDRGITRPQPDRRKRPGGYPPLPRRHLRLPPQGQRVILGQTHRGSTRI